MEEIYNVISTVGFPIAITIYLLFERGKILKELTKAINNLSLIIHKKMN